MVIVNAADPLNLVGILSNQPRVPRIASNRWRLWQGRAVAALQSGEIEFLAPVPDELRADITERLGTLSAALTEEADDAQAAAQHAADRRRSPANMGRYCGRTGERQPQRGRRSANGRGDAGPRRYPNGIPRPTPY